MLFDRHRIQNETMEMCRTQSKESFPNHHRRIANVLSLEIIIEEMDRTTQRISLDSYFASVSTRIDLYR